MANTFELISSTAVGAGGVASITFSSIASTWTDLCVKLSGRSTYASAQYVDVNIKINASTSGYSERMLYGDGSAAASAGTSGSIINWGSTNAGTSTANAFGSMEFYIPNYAQSNNKSLSLDRATETNAITADMGFLAALWSNSAAITSIQLIPSIGNFAQYSTAYLYGVKNA